MMYRVNNPGCLFIIAAYIYLTTDGNYALKVDALEAGKSQTILGSLTGLCCDSFLPKTASLVGFSWSAVVRINQKCPKEGNSGTPMKGLLVVKVCQDAYTVQSNRQAALAEGTHAPPVTKGHIIIGTG